MDAVHQTGSDGSPLLTPYIVVIIFTVLLLLPLTPFMHRITHHIPVLLFVVFVATLVFNLAAFPFSANTRYKVFFLQEVDLDHGSTAVHIHGREPYVQQFIAEMPSASGRTLTCVQSRRMTLRDCSYDGSAVMPYLGGDPPHSNSAFLAAGHGTLPTDLVTINASHGPGNSARLRIDAVNTKACMVWFDKPVSRLSVEGGSGWDDRWGPYPEEEGVGLVKLWRRDRSMPWEVVVKWSDKTRPFRADDGDEGDRVLSATGDTDLRMARKRNSIRAPSTLEGSVVCLWSDANTPDVIPALDEALKFAPTWMTVLKLTEGLVEVRKRFVVT